MNDIKKLKEQHQDEHPGFGSYLECMTRSLFTGLSAFTLGSFIAQHLLKKHLPYGMNGFMLISSSLAVGISYKITSERTKSCQAAWMAAEDKHTYFTQITTDQ